jgi:hypothetical protein
MIAVVCGGLLLVGPKAAAAPPPELQSALDPFVQMQTLEVRDLVARLPEGTFHKSRLDRFLDEEVTGDLLIDARGVPTAVFTARDVRFSWKYGEYLWFQSNTMAPQSLPFREELDAVWDELRAGFPETTFTLITTPNPWGLLQWEVSLPTASMPGVDLLRLDSYPDGEHLHAVLWSLPASGSHFPGGVRLPVIPLRVDDPTARATLDQPVDPTYLVELAEREPRCGCFPGPGTRMERPYRELFRRAEWQFDPTTSEGIDASDLWGLGPIACEGTGEQVYEVSHTLVPPDDAVSRVVLSEAECADPPWFELGLRMDGSAPPDGEQCVGSTVTLEDHGESPPRVIGSHTMQTCGRGEATRWKPHTRSFRNRWSLDDLGLTATEVDQLRVRVDMRMTLSCGSGSLGRTARVRAHFTSPRPFSLASVSSTHGEGPKRYHDLPHMAWSCPAGW